MAKIVVTNRAHDEVLARLAAEHEVDANHGTEPWSRTQLMERLSDADALMVFMPDRIDSGILAAAARLKIVAGALKGYDNLDREACTAHGVWLSVVPDLLTAPTAELTVGLMIAVGRNILAGDGFIRSGQFAGWRPHLYGAGLYDARVGIIGMGAVGCAIAERLRGFGCTVVYADRQPLQADLEAELMVTRSAQEAVLADCDFVVLAVHLTAQTKHVLNAASIARMKPGSYLINPGRGSLVDEAAVVDALERGHLAGYAADVFEMEDWARPDRPTGIAGGLLEQSDRTVLTPHLGSAVRRTRLDIEMAAATNILECLAGRRPPDAVNAPDVALRSKT